MPLAAKYIFVVSMDVDADKEDLFNEVYDTEHIPHLSKVPGVRAVSRVAGEACAVMIGGVRRESGRNGPMAIAGSALHAKSQLCPLQGEVIG